MTYGTSERSLTRSKVYSTLGTKKSIQCRKQTFGGFETSHGGDGGVGDLQLTLPVGAAAVVLFANRRVDEQQGPESQFQTQPSRL